MPEHADTPFELAAAECEAQARAAVSAMAQLHDLPGLDLTFELVNRLVIGLASIDADATASLLTTWRSAILRRAHGETVDEPAELDRMARELTVIQMQMMAALRAHEQEPTP